MCISPQRRPIFQHLNFQKWSRTLSFLSFLLPNVLFATAACNFWCHLSAPTSAPAALTGLLLDWPDTRIYEKTQHFVTSLTFGACVSFFLLTFWLLHLLSTDLTTLLLLFNSPYCRKFLFKLPSTTTTTTTIMIIMIIMIVMIIMIIMVIFLLLLLVQLPPRPWPIPLWQPLPLLLLLQAAWAYLLSEIFRNLAIVIVLLNQSSDHSSNFSCTIAHSMRQSRLFFWWHFILDVNWRCTTEKCSKRAAWTQGAWHWVVHWILRNARRCSRIACPSPSIHRRGNKTHLVIETYLGVWLCSTVCSAQYTASQALKLLYMKFRWHQQGSGQAAGWVQGIADERESVVGKIWVLQWF